MHDDGNPIAAGDYEPWDVDAAVVQRLAVSKRRPTLEAQLQRLDQLYERHGLSGWSHAFIDADQLYDWTGLPA